MCAVQLSFILFSLLGILWTLVVVRVKVRRQGAPQALHSPALRLAALARSEPWCQQACSAAAHRRTGAALGACGVARLQLHLTLC